MSFKIGELAFRFQQHEAGVEGHAGAEPWARVPLVSTAAITFGILGSAAARPAAF